MKTFSLLATAALLAATASAMAGGGGHKMDHKMMDTNGDGMISKDEFMKHQEMMWDKMKKNPTGMIAVKDMDMGMGMGMMRDHHMKSTDKTEKEKAK